MKRKVQLFDNPIVNEVEKEISKLLEIPVYNSEKELIKSLIEDEIQSSQIDKELLLSYFIDHKEKLIKFTIKLYLNESKVDNDESVSFGPGIGFGITSCIYFHFLKNDQINSLENYLNQRKIPDASDFKYRLIKYFNS